jgi:hypothetical protein
MLNVHNFISSSGSGTVINYGSGSYFLTSYGFGSGSGSGSTGQKVTVPTVPVPQHWLYGRNFSYPATLTSPVAGEAMPDPHVQPPGDRLRVQEVADSAQEAAHEEGDPGLGQGGEGQRQGHLPRLRQAQQHDR